MSAFLGPVHEWMYKRILLREHLTGQLVEMAEKKDCVTGLADVLNQTFGAIENAPLESVIDKSNIHGWLSQRVDMAERRFAKAVESILFANAAERLAQMHTLVYQFGKTYAIAPDADIEDAYQVLDSFMLDGMPCDGGRHILSQNLGELVWDYNPSMHPLCQDEKGRAVFHGLRISFLNGVLAQADFVVESMEGAMLRIRRGTADVRH